MSNSEYEYGQELEIAALKGNPALRVLFQALEDAELKWAYSVGNAAINSPKPVDQRKMDYTRGYFAGARFWLRERVSLAEARVKTADATDPRTTGRDDPRTEGSEGA